MLDGYAAVDGVLEYIHKRIDEPLSLPKLARYAAYSPFHFARLFKARVGVSVHQYIASLRLHRAKELLLGTELSVRDIALEVGQKSLGTFTTQFTAKVGVSPARFRHSEAQTLDQLRSLLSVDFSKLCSVILAQSRAQPLTGTVEADAPFEGIILLGLFSSPIAEGVPLYSTMLLSPGDFYFPDVKPGRYYLVGTTIAGGMQARDILLPYATLRTMSKAPIEVKPYCHPPHVHVKLSQPQAGDAPVLISLPYLMNRFLKMIGHEGGVSGLSNSHR